MRVAVARWHCFTCQTGRPVNSQTVAANNCPIKCRKVVQWVDEWMNNRLIQYLTLWNNRCDQEEDIFPFLTTANTLWLSSHIMSTFQTTSTTGSECNLRCDHHMVWKVFANKCVCCTSACACGSLPCFRQAGTTRGAEKRGKEPLKKRNGFCCSSPSPKINNYKMALGENIKLRRIWLSLYKAEARKQSWEHNIKHDSFQSAFSLVG